MKVSQDYLKFHTYLEGPGENKWRWFEKCVGALDGTHIPVTVSLEDRPKYRNRKGDVSTNVLAACGPDLRFIYVLPGWEGSAGDSRVLRDALRRQNKLEIPAEVQDLELLSIVDEELTSQRRERVQNNVIDEVATIQVTEEWIRFRDTLAINMFANYQAHKEARQFRFKVIVNWDDIVDLCAKDRATGHGAETAMDADEVMSREINEGELSLEGASDTIYLDEPGFTTQRRGQSSASTSTQSQRRKTGEKDGIANSLKEVAESLKRLVQAFDITIDEDAFIQEVLAEAALIPNLNQHQWAKAVKWLSDTPKQLAIVKALPIEKKAAYVLTHIS
ncbi:uncharacterized protein LOC109819160 [Cajanus cajan]|uniref:uncharacterized protein LOC109819160 n=1 Tax=Cajanus cajan TaxID=3821 RepID=UPI0010FB857B|nr:uncharacterized protein LOC109819160 [Cajanus cajan]